YINSTAENRPQSGFGRSDLPFYNLYILPRSVDITDFKNPIDEEGKMVWYKGGNVANPYWLSKYDNNRDTRNRFIMHGDLQYQFTDWLSAKIEGNGDIYTTNWDAKTYAGGTLSNSYSVRKKTFSEGNFSALITAQKDNIFGELGGSLADEKNIRQ